MQNKLWCDLISDNEKAEFLRSGRAVETGIIAPSMVDEIASIYEERAANKQSAPCHCGAVANHILCDGCFDSAVSR